MTRRHENLIPPHSVPWLAGLAALGALCVAWIGQYGFGLAPCELCVWQRYGYWAAIGVAVIACLPARQSRARVLASALLALTFLAVAAIALFHAGVEYQWWRGFTSCAGDLGQGQSVADILAAIENAPIVRCDEPAFLLFGVSMAGYNFLYALGLATFAAWGVVSTHRRETS